MRRSLILTLLIALSLPVATLAQSGLRPAGDVATATGAYEAEVPVNSQAEADRNGALARALSVVLGKLSGDRSVMSRPGLRLQAGPERERQWRPQLPYPAGGALPRG
ncbi:hypothetical protein G6F64_015131 [Rhizopus arrhizus]|uniref:Uncharacterized protein n=1 Tax=Rhizopus oryzae TaxID=64495 RepID=A0A9P6WS49_RHIOR|nr:hypothetical protein G6F64_015131 [Rhizopus arrhizus]